MITQPDKNISGDSKKWKNWVSVFLPNSCTPCEKSTELLSRQMQGLNHCTRIANAILQE